MTLKYRYEDLSPGQFEDLVVFLCQELLGVAVQGFSTGPDGGRDAKFMGTAELHPSKSKPWQGKTIIQAKHTNAYNRSFNESDFYSTSSEKNILGEEIPRINKLIKNNHLDNYMLFSNRRLAGNAESTIRSFIAEKCNLPEESIYLCGIEQMESWLKRFPHVPGLADIDPIDSPLIISPDDLALVVQALSKHRNDIDSVLDDPPVLRLPYERKNEINNMTEAYAAAQRKKYLKETDQVRKFLSAPENLEQLRMYELVVDEFQLQIISKRKNYQNFDEVMEYLARMLFDRDPDLRRLKKLTRVVLFYMYWNCDIGETNDAETD